MLGCPARVTFRSLWCGEASVGLPGPSVVLVQFNAGQGLEGCIMKTRKGPR